MLDVLLSNPMFAWPVLACLAIAGVWLSRTQVVLLPLMAIVPAIITWLKVDLCPIALSRNLTAIVVFGLLSCFWNKDVLVQRDWAAIRGRSFWWAQCSGTWIYLFVIAGIFATKFFFDSLRCGHPELYLQYSLIEDVVTAGLVGILWGRGLVVLYKAYLN